MERAMGKKHEHVMIGMFHTANDARRTIEELREAKFSDRKIGVLTHNKQGDAEVKSFRALERNEAVAGAAVGAVAGAGGGTIWALGIAVGVLPAIGPVIAGGLLVALAVSAASGAAAGILVGTLVGLGVTDEEAAYYDAEFRKGHTILVVQPGDRFQLVQTIMSAHNVQNRQFVTSGTLAEQIDQRHI